MNYLDHVQPVVAIKATLTVFQYSDIPFIVNIHSTEGLQTRLYCTLLRTEYKGCASPKPTKNHLPKSTKKDNKADKHNIYLCNTNLAN